MHRPLSVLLLAAGLSLLLPIGAAENQDERGPYLVVSPMIGHVSSSNALVWVNASTSARSSIRIGSQPDLSDAREMKGPQLETDSGFMGTLIISSLEPERTYHYCIFLSDRPAMLPPYPSFKTAPPEGQPIRVRVAFSSCVGYHGYDAAPGYADMATRTNLDLVLLIGDNHYANTNAAVVQRQFYHEQRRVPGWGGLAASTPIYAIWDDHDYGPDNSDRRLKGKEESLKTFREHWANPSYGQPDDPGIYFTFSRGNVEFFMLDDRYYRDPNKATNLTHKTMLGEKQLAWLKRELLASKAAVKLLVNGSEWQSNGTDDSWTSFLAERDEIFSFIEAHHIEGVLLLSGDRHFTGAYQVKGKWIEVTAGPLGSSNARTKNLPEMFLNLSDPKAKFYCIYDIDTRPRPPEVTLEVYRVAEGLAERWPFTWDEVLGLTSITPLPPSPSTPEKPRTGGTTRRANAR